MARPKAAQARTIVVGTRFTAAEHAVISAAADGARLGTVVRQLALAQAAGTKHRRRPRAPTTDVVLLRRELNRVGVNLNQACRTLNELARGTTRRNTRLLEALEDLRTATAAVRDLVTATTARSRSW